LSSLDKVGDGFGIFSGTTDFRVDATTTIEMNDRAAGLVDDGSKQGIIIIGGKISASVSGYKVVVQNTVDGAVNIADTDKTIPPAALGVSSPKIAPPSIL
jgi:hypothetical protein